MSLKDMREMAGMSQRGLANITNIPISTIQNWEQGRRKMPDYMEDLIKSKLIIKGVLKEKTYYSTDFYHFRSDLHHRIKYDELKTMLYIINNNLVEKYWIKGNPLFSLYSLSVLDYLSEKNGFPYVEEYDYYRQKKLAEPFFVKDTVFLKDREKEIKNALHPFVKHNIIEGDLFDAQ